MNLAVSDFSAIISRSRRLIHHKQLDGIHVDKTVKYFKALDQFAS